MGESFVFSREKSITRVFWGNKRPLRSIRGRFVQGENSFSGESELIPSFFQTPGGGTGLGMGKPSCPCCVGAAGWAQNIFITRELEQLSG